MSTRDRLTLAAAVAVAMASSALHPVYEDLGWLVRVLLGISAVAGASALARLVGVPRVLQPLAAAVGLGAYVAFAFASQTLAYGVVPTVETFTLLGRALDQGLLDVSDLAPPVPTTPGLVLLAVLGTGAVAIVVDAIAVVLRKVAVAGLPLLLLFAVPSAVLPGGTGFLPFVLGACGWLGLLLADSSDRVSRWGTPLRSARPAASDPSLGRVGRRIGAAALGVAVIVPALVPGLDGRLLGGSGDGSGFGGSRTTTTYNPLLSLAGQLRLPTPQELFTYTTEQDPDYIRLTTLDVFDERSGWSSSELSGDVKDDAVSKGVPAPPGRSAPTQRVVVEVDLARRLDGPWLPTPTVPDDVDIKGPWIWDAEAETIFSTRTSVREVDRPYVVTASRVEPDAATLRRAQTVPSAIRDTYAVPPALSDYTRDLLDRTTADQPTAYDKVAALQALFRGPGFSYSEDASAIGANAADPLENFLRGRVGYCEQFASAMGAMVRALGIPARVAVGFTPGSQAEPGRYRVTTSEAHAWPEVWFTDVGWVRFEPTPRLDQVQTPGYTVPPDETVTDTPDTAAPSTAPAAPETGPTTDPSAGDRAGRDGATAAGSGSDGAGLSPYLLAGPAVLLLLGSPALLALARRRRRWRSPDPLVAWSSISDDAVDVGHRWRPADSPRAAGAHLLAVRALPSPAAEALERLAVSAERARYAPAGDPDDESATALRRDAAAVREGLLTSASARERWTARLLPASTLQWAYHGVGGRTADLLDRLDALVSAVGDRVRHPRAAARRAG